VGKVETRRSLLANWRRVLATGNPPRGTLDPVSRWLVLTRAAVLPMTLTAALIAGLLGVNERGFDWGLFVLAGVGILLAHVSNNLMNDLFDLGVGTDTENYPRALYAPHPVLSGMITRSGLAAAALTVNLVDLAVLAVLTAARGWAIVGFALGGFLISVAYTAPPLRLKKRGLGEPSVLAVWGPLSVVWAGRSSPRLSPTPCWRRPCSWASTSTSSRGMHPRARRRCPCSWEPLAAAASPRA